MERKLRENHLRDEIAEIVEQNGCSLYDLREDRSAKHVFYKVFVDKKQGVRIEDCEAIFKSLNFLFHHKEISNYRLEVSSPGLERHLSRASHFEQALGKKIRFVFDQHSHSGILKSVDIEKNFISVEINSQIKEFLLDKVKKGYVEFFKTKKR